MARNGIGSHLQNGAGGEGHSNGIANGDGDHGPVHTPIKSRTERDIIRLIGQHLKGLGLQ